MKKFSMVSIPYRNWFASVFLLLTFFLGLPTSGFSDDFQYQGLAPGEGREQVFDNCTACHSTAIILQNHMTRQKWDETLTWMQEKQGLWNLDPELKKIILDYLATHQGPKTSSPQNPLGHQFTYRPNPL